MAIADAIEKARTKIAAKQNKLLPDLCDIDGPMFVDGGAAGDTVSIGTVARNLSIKYKGLGVGKQIQIGGESYVASHSLKMVRTAKTVAITPRHKIRVKPSGLIEELIFEKPLINHDSEGPFLFLDAILVQQGFQQ
jgi:hypothetical protein